MDADMDKDHATMVLMAIYRRFARLLQEKLPRELRDLVYERYWDNEFERRCLDPILIMWEQGTCPGPPCKCLEYWIRPAILDSRFVGTVIPQEALQAYYRSMGNKVRLSTARQNIARYLASDSAHVGLRPASVIQYMHLSVEVFAETSFRQVIFVNKTDPRPPKSLQENLDGLRLIENKKLFRLHVRIYFQKYRISFPDLTNVLEAISSAAQFLKAEGSMVTISLEDHEGKYSLDITEYLHEDASQWEDRFKKDYAREIELYPTGPAKSLFVKYSK